MGFFIEILAVFMILAFILFKLNEKKHLGKVGEFWVKEELRKLPDYYRVLNDVTLRKGNRICQIDHIVFSKYGIFVIETKHYHGYITGNDYDKKWEIKNNNKKYYVQNPLHQNYGHLKLLQEELHLEESNFISIVCLTAEAKLNIKSDNVVPVYELINKIRSYNKPIIENYLQLYHYIDFLNREDSQSKKEHLEYAQRKKMENVINSIDRCPRCGGKLVDRVGKYGTFKGCSNYPKCKYIETKKNIQKK